MSQGLGWVKMNGKKSKVLGCGCCVAEDHRDEILWKEAANEMRFDAVRAAEDMRGEFAYMDEVSDRDNIENSVDSLTYARYTWGQGMSDLRIEAIMAQQHADYLKRAADLWDELMAVRAA